jgi:sugar/nucleoside kinase (ribokinase family)
MRVALDPSSHPLLDEVGAETFFAWTEGVDYVFPNLAEGRALTGRDTPEEMARDLAGRYGEVILTCGAEGALWCSRGAEIVAVPAMPGPVVDTTGAGDAFAAGFLAARLEDSNAAEALAAGARLARRVVSQVGARPAHPTRDGRARSPARPRP